MPHSKPAKPAAKAAKSAPEKKPAKTAAAKAPVKAAKAAPAPAPVAKGKGNGDSKKPADVKKPNGVDSLARPAKKVAVKLNPFLAKQNDRLLQLRDNILDSMNG